MENEIRRTLDELVARYVLEPDLRDIYVEGKTDKLFLEWFLRIKFYYSEIYLWEISF